MRKVCSRLSLLLIFSLLITLMPTNIFANISTTSEIVVDELVDWSRVYKRSEKLSLQVYSDADDPTRVNRSYASNEYLTYRTNGPIRTFSLYTYYRPNNGPYNHPNFYVSRDGMNYEKAAPQIYEDGDNKNYIVYEVRNFHGDTRFMKIEYTGSDIAKSPSIGKVVLNGPSGVNANLPSGFVPYGSMVMLERADAGDTVYYTTDGSDPRTSLTRKLYSSPIKVVNELVLKITAVNHSASGKAAASRVSTYRYVTKGSLDAAVGFDDPLDNFKQIASRSSIYIERSTPYYFGNDSNRMARISTKPGNIIYHTDYDISSFMVYSYFFTGNAIEKHRFFISENGKDYTEISAEAYSVGHPVANWQKYAYEASSLPADTRYLKIELHGSAMSWSPQVSNVMFNRSTASVDVQSTRSTESLKTVLSTATSGAKIFYRLNKAPVFQPYSKPLKLTGYNVLETYAVKKGMEPSPIRKYALNASNQIQVDRFGQMTSAKFPEKVINEQQLKADAEADASYYDSLSPPSDRDRYGGLAGSAAKYGLQETGFFAIQQMGSRKVMTTPEGNLFFSLGVNGLTAHETFTMVKGREELFESIPSKQEKYKPAFIGSDNFSFYLANKYRKTGVFPTEHSIYSEAAERLRKWGFNSAGGFSPEKYGNENNLPYVRTLPLSSMNWAKIDGISIFDIFAPNAEVKIDKSFAKALKPNKDDPMLIGYFIDNEYDFHKFYSHVPKLKASKAAIKGRLVQRLKDKYQDIDKFNSSWGTSFQSFEDLKEAELPLNTSPAWRDMDAFFRYYLDTFFETVSRIYRKYDPNHLLLGDRWITTPFHNEKFRSVMAEVEGKYVDVISINYYSYKLETDLLEDVYTKSGGKPILLSEFGYGTAEQGLKPLLPNAAVNQFQRGMRYRNYVEGAASLDYIVGAHVFNYVDQAGLGRYWQGVWGERYNSGIVNVADRPYKKYLEGIMATNYDIYKVILEERPKFYYEFR
ncbi:chitobiase/beta-hexosaminidase C-terminal domain-containing protein [Paenibacillus alkaliterrae]|uniref:chitobiase/beta-hexosaminidase C-terminal domain-containing protein n=1 Tax=Paenibacillus alkaliterrae TaxID=320909 RepID=UPI001F4892B9|nr:chitobiase/beta-hexosaminidase C-terminal domain-containing protein [Paenibacillus alkaliterrae]MCF2937928.1 chitobiase/beta-hexosaminidase C-terminal domain-containing protein [Paenibacillus alkaliterrae]